MTGPSIDVITISREFGAGGSELAEHLGARLGWRVLDRELVRLTAEHLRLAPEVVARLDERTPRLLARLAGTLAVMPPESPLIGDGDFPIDPDAVFGAARAVVLAAAAEPPVILVGHGGQCLLRDRPGTLHVRLLAPLADRVRRICAREGCDSRHAAADADEIDAMRRRYVQRHFRCDLRDASLYDLVINTGRVPVAAAATMIASIVAR